MMVRKSWLKILRQLIGQSRQRTSRRPNKSRRFAVAAQIETLELRALLSAAATVEPIAAHPLVQQTPTTVHPTYVVSNTHASSGVSPDQTSSPFGLTPSQVRTAYGMNLITIGSVAGDGSGQTIAIVDAYDDPNAISDLKAFDSAFSFADPPSFQVVNQNGGSNLPLPDAGWSIEESLDIEWAHVMAPKANIILFEANDNSYNNLLAAVDTARNTPGVSVVSMSFGGGEFAGETTLDGHFLTPMGHQGVTFVASTGDDGEPGGYPAYSPNVVAVGGTSLFVDNSGNYLGELGWGGSGGGTSTVEAIPTYQKNIQTTMKREIPDVAMDADPDTGVPVYDSYANGASTPWEQVGGTSLAAPLFAGVMAVSNQNRVASGLGTFDGSTQTLPTIYGLPASDFHDVTTGNNGFSAGTGYDLVTGRGSPVANQFALDLSNVIVSMNSTNNNITLQESPTDSTVLQVLSGTTVLATYKRSTFTSVIVTGDTGNDTLTVNLGFGNFMSTATVNYTGGGGIDGLAVEGTSSDTGTYVASSSSLAGSGTGVINLDNSPVSFTGVTNLDATSFGAFTVAPSGADENLTLTNGKNLTAGVVGAASVKTINVSGFVVDPTADGTVNDSTIALWNLGTLTVTTGNTQIASIGTGINWLVVSSADGSVATGASITNLNLVSGGTLGNNLLWPGNVTLDGSLTGDVSGDINTFTGPIVTGSSVTLRATRSLEVTSSTGTAITAGGTVYLAADTTSAGVGDDGVGQLMVVQAVTSGANSLSAITLIGATYSAFGPKITTTGTSGGIVIHPSLPSIPMNIGGTFVSISGGMNLPDSALVGLLPAATGSVTYGSSSQTGNITLNTAQTVATVGATTNILQSNTGPGQIILDDGDDNAFSQIGLDGNGGFVRIQPGLGGVVADLFPNTIGAPAELPMAAGGFNANGLTLNLVLKFVPVVGTAYTIVSNTSNNPFVGTFVNLPANGVFSTVYNGTLYSFVISYKGGDGNDLVLTSVASGSATLSNIETTVLQYTEATTTPITSSLIVTPVGQNLLNGATVQISGNYNSTVDSLIFKNTATITGTWNPTTGILTLSGADTTQDYQAAFRSVSYFNSTLNPVVVGGLSRTITFATPNGNSVSTQSRNLTIIAVNHAPIIVLDSGTVTAPENVATAISPGLLLTDPDNATLPAAYVRILGNFQPTQDTLVFASTATIKTTWDPNLGILKLYGVDTVANYQAALRSVKFLNTSQSQVSSTRTLSFYASDGLIVSTPVTRQLIVQAVHVAPLLAGIETASLPYTQNSPATPITSSLTASDIDASTLTSATVKISSGFLTGQDVLSFTNTGLITGSWNASTGTLTLSGTDTVADYQAALRTVKFFSSNTNTSSASRTISFQVNDGASVNNLSNIVTRSVGEAAVPLLSNIETAPVTYGTQGSSGVQVTAAIQIADVSNNTLTSAKVTITNVQTGDVLTYTGMSGITGAYNSTTGVLTFTGSSTLANYTTLLRSVHYANFATSNPSQIQRVVTFQVFNVTGASNIVSRSINYSATLSTVEPSTLVYRANTPAVAVSNTLSIIDSNSSEIITGAVIYIGANFIPNREILLFTRQHNITGSYYSSTGRLILTGNDTVADYQAALRSIKFQYTGTPPTTPLSQTISFQISTSSTPNVYTSNIVTRNIIVTS